VDRKQVELGLLGLPPYFFEQRIAESTPDLEVVFFDGEAERLEVTFGCVFIGNDAVDRAPGVAQEVKRLSRPPHHAEA
ncbi:MAG: hypothetical protein IID15_03540, partial [Candidatus Marinimicrobia bacterium]|nr:hypothetical protein [Candidatus Neomarinimicrobiota bacterium]